MPLFCLIPRQPGRRQDRYIGSEPWHARRKGAPLVNPDFRVGWCMEVLMRKLLVLLGLMSVWIACGPIHYEDPPASQAGGSAPGPEAPKAPANPKSAGSVP